MSPSDLLKNTYNNSEFCLRSSANHGKQKCKIRRSEDTVLYSLKDKQETPHETKVTFY